MKIVVLAGGRSTERNVSLTSGHKITNALQTKGHDVAFVDLFLGNDLHDVASIDDLYSSTPVEKDYDISDEVLTDDAINALRTDGSTQLFGPNVLEICKTADIVFLALHGGDGEDGKVQAVLDLFGIPYTGSDTLAAGITMSKKVSKEILLYNQIPTARFVAAYRDQPMPEIPFEYPVVVKPSNGGSSVGTHIVHNEAELQPAVEDALRFDREALIEEFIKGREFSLGVINGQPLPAIEIVVNDGWYDFEHKFVTGNTTQFVTPPNDLPDDVHEAMKQMALDAMQALGLTNYARIDFFWSPENGLYVIEGNTLPGMTPLSLIPQEAEVLGISYPDLCEMIVQGKLELLKAK
ncbi:D-alanine--D-alanine ligase [Latilactobacillus curvatus]|uniref:D-alanine--D-alanine ligase n=1 Tax=Latilactobacillus curvatus TaxID=28038 RepID=A0AAC9Y006_LATCU|nr:D-alanine--D-alanine ligase [Latilactobacillus curvatus]ASN59162.1 D-alanine--D-alanine ligase [Latilactobacillus curvatus]MDG2979758.1 D-alanine--D-alanine ligase [Latilactobacillus curvatus]MDT3393912.1 D-alanine--D-alanine ligase [Bacillota bacterium]